MTENINTFATMIAAASNFFDKSNVPGAVVIPANMEVADLENYLPMPRRVRNNVNFKDVASFLAYYERFKEGVKPVIFGKFDNGIFSLRCVFDYDEDSAAPRHGDNVAQLTLIVENDFARWQSLDRKMIGQEAFADFIEDFTQIFISPDGATMLEMVQELQGSKKVEWIKGTRLQNGQQSLEYQETLTAAGRKGSVTVPSTFTIKLPIFKGLEPVSLDVNLRWRMDDEKRVHFGYKIMGLDKHITDATGQIIDAVQKATGLQVLNLA